MLLINLLTFFSYILFTNASPANPKLLQAFLDCLKFNNATNYGLSVENNGYLSLAPLNPQLPANSTPFRICDPMFGLGFYASFDNGYHTYHDGKNLKDIENFTGDQLVELGVVSRDVDVPEINNIMANILSSLDAGVVNMDNVGELLGKPSI
ncbi:hypothetical protein DAPK24_030610 [Pichia kluyveri]|uniref:Uncharacterized protein n=1 Tax=Pichia kluyveri TaxID=36015 RepID=A0AAV5R4P1_PICKL|nr:hypothetical protein DAPK24_030610 [Pichia kluyveri]